MFNEFVEARAGEAGRKGWSILILALCQAGTLLVLLLVPLVYTDALPNALKSIQSLFVPVPLVDAPKPPPMAVERHAAVGRIFDGDQIYLPKSFPTHPQIFEEAPLPPELPAGANGDFGMMNLLSGMSEGRSEAGPAAPVEPVPLTRIRVSEIQPAMIISAPQPVYPKLALLARIQGDVFLHAIIDREGRVAELQVVSGHPLLVTAALEAVRTWRYRPTLLNRAPIEVETVIKVSFVLGR